MSGCYKIPIGAVPQATPGFIPAAIVQGPCCNVIYIEAIRCGHLDDGIDYDHTLSVWLPLNAVPSFPYSIKAGTTCYVVSEGNTQTATPDGVILLTWSETSGCDDPGCDGGGGGDPTCSDCGDCSFADNSHVTVSIPELASSDNPETIPDAITALNAMSKDLAFDHIESGPIFFWTSFSDPFSNTAQPDDTNLYQIRLYYVLLCASGMKAYIKASIYVSTDGGTTWVPDTDHAGGNPIFLTTSSDTDAGNHDGDIASCTDFFSEKYYNYWLSGEVVGGDPNPITSGSSTASVASNACE